ncbi:hypothetical protein BH11PSE11_BH11PSE11_12440 [soil metagenome]
MDDFVADLTHLYRLAAKAPVEEFPQQAVGQLRKWMGFDGAVFGFGETGSNALNIGNAYIYNRDDEILRDYAAVSENDPMTRMFLQRPHIPLNVDARALYARQGDQSVARFSSRHDLRHLLLLGEASGDQSRLRWIVLYRGTAKAFDQCEVHRLSAAWSHMLCALELNRARTLDLHTPPHERRALALVSTSGAIEIADQGFMDLVRMEWHDMDATRLQADAIRAMQNGSTFCGKHLEIGFSRRGDYIVCEARPLNAKLALSPREWQVAEYFSVGYSNKEIARLLDISPNTVRVQLARIYQKLRINDKAQLAAALANVWTGPRDACKRPD